MTFWKVVSLPIDLLLRLVEVLALPSCHSIDQPHPRQLCRTNVMRDSAIPLHWLILQHSAIEASTSPLPSHIVIPPSGIKGGQRSSLPISPFLRPRTLLRCRLHFPDQIRSLVLNPRCSCPCHHSQIFGTSQSTQSHRSPDHHGDEGSTSASDHLFLSMTSRSHLADVTPTHHSCRSLNHHIPTYQGREATNLLLSIATGLRLCCVLPPPPACSMNRSSLYLYDQHKTAYTTETPPLVLFFPPEQSLAS